MGGSLWDEFCSKRETHPQNLKYTESVVLVNALEKDKILAIAEADGGCARAYEGAFLPCQSRVSYRRRGGGVLITKQAGEHGTCETEGLIGVSLTRDIS